MNVYIVFDAYIGYGKLINTLNERVIRVFDSEDKAIDFIQKLISEKLNDEYCIYDEVPSKEYIRENSIDIPYYKDDVCEYSYSYSRYNIY